MNSNKRQLFFVVPLSLAILSAVFIWGFSIGNVPEFKIAIPEIKGDLDTYLNQKENHFHPTKNTEKKIFWHSTDKVKTEYSLVSLHGFSATRQEVSPVNERLAADLGWNLFATRLVGHGLGSQGMYLVTAEGLLADAEEAFQIGQKIGEKVILTGTSTGAPLALWLALQHPETVAGIVLLSPNFRPADPLSFFTRGPMGEWVTHNIVKTHTWKADTSEIEQYWTTRYPTTSVHEMMELLLFTDGFNLQLVKCPVLVLYSEKDDVVSISEMKNRFLEFPEAKRKMQEVVGASHILAGRYMGNKFTDQVVKTIEDFLRIQTQAHGN